MAGLGLELKACVPPNAMFSFLPGSQDYQKAARERPSWESQSQPDSSIC